MAVFTLTALPAYDANEAGRSYVSRFVDFGGDSFGRCGCLAKTLNDLRLRVAEFGATIATAHPDASFVVSVTTRDRKIAGFDHANRHNGLGGEAWVRTFRGAHADIRKLGEANSAMARIGAMVRIKDALVS